MTTTRDFCIWMKSYFDFNPEGPISEEKAKIIANKLNDVFVHEIPQQESLGVDVLSIPTNHISKITKPNSGGNSEIKYRC